MGLLSGLADLGLDGLSGRSLYEEEKKEEKKVEEVKKVVPEDNESDYLLRKKIVCPMCKYDFLYSSVKTGKARLIETQDDLRGVYKTIDPNKYQIIGCPKCGYAAFINSFATPSKNQVTFFKNEIFGKAVGLKNPEVLSYDEAIMNYRMALAAAMVMKKKDSEKAHLALRLGWCYRGKAESLIEGTCPDIESIPGKDPFEKLEYLRKCELEALQAAYEGFDRARASETFPIASMNEFTLDYVLGVLAFKVGNLENASRYISLVMASRSANRRIKDKALDIKEQILEKKKTENANN